MKKKVIILLTMFFTSCLAAAVPTPSEVNAVLTKYKKNPKNWSALNYAIETNDFESALVLIDYVMDFNRIDEGLSPLSRAILHFWQKERLPNKYKLKFIKKLILKGADLKGHPLSCACQAGNVEIIETMLSTGIQIAEFNGSAFNQAIYCGRFDIVRLLISKGVDVKVGTPLASAIMSRPYNYELIELLLQAGANTDIRLGFDVPPLLYALSDLKLAELLLKYGADPNAKVPKDRGSSILGIFLENIEAKDNEKIVQLLLDYGAKLI